MVVDVLTQQIEIILAEMGVSGVPVDIQMVADARHGDYTTNVALRLAKSLKQSPMAIALQVKEKLEAHILAAKAKALNQTTTQKDQKDHHTDAGIDRLQDIESVSVAAPGFLNVTVTEAMLSSQIYRVLKEKERFGTSQKRVPLSLGTEVNGDAHRIMVEFAHPNTHKAFHIGHLRNITTGESVVRLLEATGHEVIRVNYQGDVGMHIAKCLWAMTHISECDPSTVENASIHEKVSFLGKAYAAGSTRYESDTTVKEQTGVINKQIYAKDPAIYPLYQKTRQWSLEYFAGIYKRVGTHYDRLYFESECYEKGKAFVRQGLERGVFVESEGAVIFPGETYGLHNRVFITKEGNATYEGKEIALGRLQVDEYNPDVIIHVVGPEQAGYFQVLFSALAAMFPEMKGREYHKIYGWVKLKHGKMSSRTGQVVLGEWLLDEAKKAIYDILKQNKSNYTKEEQDVIAETAAVAAVKYSLLKVGTDSEIAFDLAESVTFDGDSGPYLLYSYARCQSVLKKAGSADNPVSGEKKESLLADERALARTLSFYPDIVATTAKTLSPNVLCTYLFDLAQTFNGLYARHPIAGDAWRVAVTEATAQVLSNGLSLLGISTLERM